MSGLPRRGRAALLTLALVGAPLVVAALTVSPAAAATVTVDSTGDPAVGNPANCPAVPAGTCTLRDAIVAADAGAGADTVSVAVGPIALTQGTLVHASASPLTVNGNGNPVTQTTAADLLQTNGPLSVDNVVASGGITTLNAFGPVSVTGSSLTTNGGDAVVSYGGGTSVTVSASTITSSGTAVNAAQDATVTGSTLASAAGLGALAIAGNVVVDGSSVSGAAGGAIAGTNATVTGSRVSSTGGQGVLAGIGGTASIADAKWMVKRAVYRLVSRS